MTFFDFFWDGKHMSYDKSFAMEMAKIIALVSAVIFVINIILSIIIYCLLRPKKNKETAINMSETFFDPVKEVKPVAAIVLETINIILFWMVIVPISMIYVVYSVFNYIPSLVCGLLIFLTGTFGIIVQIWRHSNFWKNRSFKKRVTNSCKYFKILLAFELFSVLFFSFFFPFAFQKGCLCVYNTGYGVETFLDLQFSTEWTRSNWLPDSVCQQGKLCHIYASLTENTANEVFINVHSGTDIDELKLIAKLDDNSTQFDCEKIPFPKDIEKRGQRNVFTCLATGLKPSTLYNLDLVNKDKVLNQTKYKTIAEFGTQNDLTVLFGGDWGYQKNGLLIVEQISKVNPDAILIGGDVAYDNGNIHCYYSWDLLLNVFEAQFTEKLIPFIFSVGNHDVGFNDYAEYNITVSDNGPLYFTYFPQRKNKDNSIPKVKDRVPFNIQKMQNILIFGLDSGYLYSHNGTQTEWMTSILEDPNYKDYSKFAHYHVPIYPTCFSNTSFMASWSNIMKARETWVPIFDKYEFVGAFENHVHQYKRTFPLKNSTQAAKGTVYFGDGSMGIRTVACNEKHQTYGKDQPFEFLFETVNTNNDSDHFWVLKSFGNNQSIVFNAYKPDYKLIDKSNYVVQKVQEYEMIYDL